MKNILYNKINLLCFIWAMPTLHFVLNPGYDLSPLPTWIAVFLSIFISLKNKTMLPMSFPFIALLSPLAVNGKILNLLPSELFLLALFTVGIVLFLLRRKTFITLLNGESYLIILLILVFTSYVASLQFQALFKSLLSWIMIATVFCSTRVIIKSRENIDSYFFVIMVCIFYCSIITLVSFFNGIVLSDFVESSIYNKQKMYYEDYLAFLRAGFFYANIGYIISPAAIISLMFSINSFTLLNRLLYGTLFVIFVALLFLMVEKTGLAALSIALMFLFLVNYITPRIKARKGKLIKLIFVSIIPFFGYVIFTLISSISNYDISAGGFTQRLCVFKSTFNVLAQNPLRFLFGFGPDSSNIINNRLTQSAKANCSGISEGAIDSGHMTFLFEYGFIFALIFILFITHCSYRIYKKIKTNPDQKIFYTILLGITVYINFAALADVIGTSKVAWIISQFFAIIVISLSYNSNSLKSEMRKSAV